MTFIASNPGDASGSTVGPAGKNSTRVGPQHRIPSLDGLRAIAISLVVLSHAIPQLPERLFGQLWRFDLGNLGVRVFFVISGFLITSLLLAETERSGSIKLTKFYLRRTLRIMPPYYCYIAIISLFAGASLESSHILAALTYTSNYFKTSWYVGHSWSLSVEEQFYLLWPGLLVLAGLRGGFKVAIALLLVCPVLRTLAVLHTDWPTNPRYAFECVADSLATGCILARFKNQIWALSAYRRLIESRIFSFFWILILACSMVGVRWPLVGSAVGISILNILSAVLIDGAVRRPESGIGRVLNFAPIRYVGVLSYSIYLWQQPFFAEGNTMPIGLKLLAILGCACLSYFLVERPALGLRTRIESIWFNRA